MSLQQLAGMKARDQLGIIRLPVKDPPVAARIAYHNILDPHVLFATMHNEFPKCFEDRLCGGSFDNIRRFWRDMDDAGHPAFVNHEMQCRHAAKYQTHAIPITIHGDGAPISGLGKSWLKLAEIHSWSSCLSRGRSWGYNFMVFVMYEGLMAVRLGVTTRARFFKRLSWSLFWDDLTSLFCPLSVQFWQ